MKRILFCWQLGANYGHLGQDLPVAEALRARGADVSFALPDLRLAAERLAPRGFPYVMAPVPLGAPTPPFPLGNFAEILLTTGFADELVLTGLVEGWRRLLDLTQPDAVILDYAPMALLAARLSRVPAMQLSTGFDVPPSITPLPSILPPGAVPSARLVSAEALVAKRISAILASSAQQSCSSIQELLTSVPTLMMTFPELDHYGPCARADYIGPVLSDPPGATVAWPEGARRRVFAYLRPQIPGVQALLEALAASGASVVCAMPRATRTLASRYECDTFRLLPRAVPLGPLLVTADVVVSYGGVGMTAAALLAGVPLLIAPQLVEQQLIGARVSAMGAGRVLLGERSQADCAHALKSLFENDGPRNAARAFARQHAGYSVAQAVGRVADAIDSLLGKTAPPHVAPAST